MMFAPSRPVPFGLSLLTHGLILVWVASGPVREQPKSIYAAVIAPHSSKIVWYDFRRKLPDVSPARAHIAAKPPRLEAKIASQEIVAGSLKMPRAKQFVWQPAPKLELKQDLKSPNILAVQPPQPHPPALPSAPQTQGTALPRAGPRAFVAPAPERSPDRSPALPAAPAVTEAANTHASTPLGLDATPVVPHRDFVPPRPPAKPSPFGVQLPDAPAIAESASASSVSMAIVGLNPKESAPAPIPDGARNARLAAGPQPRTTGAAEGASTGALLTVPGLMIRKGAPDAQPTLMARAASPTSAANLRAALRDTLPTTTIAGNRQLATRVSHAPDPVLEGRDTYAMSIQMPNITSYTGSWMIWFAERRDDARAGGLLSPPVPLRKVDPKYFPAAIADRVEGKVRLAAVIRKDGSVDSVKLLEHLDDRLDHSAQEAMDKWKFEPALRDGQPIDVDAVIEIPFRLAPRTTR